MRSTFSVASLRESPSRPLQPASVSASSDMRSARLLSGKSLRRVLRLRIASIEARTQTLTSQASILPSEAESGVAPGTGPAELRRNHLSSVSCMICSASVRSPTILRLVWNSRPEYRS